MKALAVISIGLGACLAAQAAQAEMLVHLSRATASQMTLSGYALLLPARHLSGKIMQAI